MKYRKRKAAIAVVGAAVLSGGLATGVSMTAHGVNDVGRVNNPCRDLGRDLQDDGIIGRASFKVSRCGTARFRIG